MNGNCLGALRADFDISISISRQQKALIINIVLRLRVSAYAYVKVWTSPKPFICILYVLFQIVAVCDFYTYVRYIQQGLVKADGKPLNDQHTCTCTC